MSSPQRVDLSGTWKMVRVDNFDAYLQAIGISLVVRAIAKRLGNTCVIEQEGDTFHIKDINTFKTTEVTFQIGIPVEGSSFIGWYKLTVTWDGDVLRGYTETDKEIIRTERYIREDGTMLYSMTAPNGEKTTQIFVKQ